MKILHTADWHLGQTFMQKSRKDEHQLFINWLLATCKQEQIDVLIVAGDIFDVSNPSVEAMDMYHHFLLEAYKLNIEVVIVGGNHDSASRLNTTQSILNQLNIHVVGGEKNALSKIIPLKNKNTSEVEVVLVAVPYLRDGEIREISAQESNLEANEKFPFAVKKHYDDLLQEAKNQYPNQLIITTGHLYVTGSALSGNEKDLHSIGTLGQISSACFNEDYAYVALGHIHKPQIIKHPSETIVKYAGSPIPLSFSERDDLKEVTILEINEQKFTPTIIQIPQSRALIRIKGTENQIIEKLNSLSNNENKTLNNWVEIIITEKVNFRTFNENIREICALKNVEILKGSTDLPKEIFHNVREEFIAEMDNNPLDNIEKIFEIKCQKGGLNEENINELKPLLHFVINHLNQ